jgi:predicted deacylase
MASGDRLSLQLYKFTGATPGKKAYIQANLHGAENLWQCSDSPVDSILNHLGQTASQGEKFG